MQPFSYGKIAQASQVAEQIEEETSYLTFRTRIARCSGQADISGPNQGCYFPLTDQQLKAQAALELGVVNEVLPPDQLMLRAMELADKVAVILPPRYGRVIMIHRLRQLIGEGVGCGLALEELGSVELNYQRQKGATWKRGTSGIGLLKRWRSHGNNCTDV